MQRPLRSYHVRSLTLVLQLLFYFLKGTICPELLLIVHLFSRKNKHAFYIITIHQSISTISLDLSIDFSARFSNLRNGQISFNLQQWFSRKCQQWDVRPEKETLYSYQFQTVYRKERNKICESVFIKLWVIHTNVTFLVYFGLILVLGCSLCINKTVSKVLNNYIVIRNKAVL